MYFETFTQMHKMLGQLDTWLEAAVAYAATRKFDANTLLVARLAPDQLPLGAQIGIACDTAKLGAARLTGRAAPSHADDQKTIEEVRARVASVREYLAGFERQAFAESATRSITQPRWEGKTMTGLDYFTEHVVPNFYFHVAHTYALLRHNGVPIGKKDYLGTLTQTAPAA